MKVQFSYLGKQFFEIDHILESVKKVALRGDFTLGKEVDEFEEKFAQFCGVNYAVGVNSGTDAIFLSLKMLGIGQGDEVITAPNTFFATVGAIVATGAKPVFVDVNDEYLMDHNLLYQTITPRTKAIIPVHLTGNICNMVEIMEIANWWHKLFVVEDACQAVGASLYGKKAGFFGDAGAFSLHPLKNLNVWGDGGMITTNFSSHDKKLRKLRNHGLSDRNTCDFYAYNSRLSTVQAAVGLEVFKDLDAITQARSDLARTYDEGLGKLDPHIKLPPRPANKKHVFHLYMVLAEERDLLVKYLTDNGVEAKVHYPVPLHLQPASERLQLGYQRGDFPVCESQAEKLISLPLHQYMSFDDVEFVVGMVKNFYSSET